MVLEGTAAVGLQTGSYRALSAHAWRHGLSGSLWEGNATAHCRILDDNYAPAMSLIPAPVVWQEDNAPSHNSKSTRDWKKANFQYPELDWPPQSPDLAPMDYSIWQALFSALPAERFPSKVPLKAAIARAFAVAAASDVPDKAVSAFRNRFPQCLDADGGHFEARLFTDVAFLVRVKK